MKRQEYNTKEALERVKLMMNYDSRKTLTENKEVISKQKSQINEIAPLIIPAITIAAPWLWAAGAAGVAAIGAWIYNVQGGGDSFSKTKNFFAGCDTNIKNLKTTVSKQQYRAAAESIFDAIDGVGTNLSQIKTALSGMPTIADLCALNSWYNTQYGDLYDDLDSDIDGTDFTKYVWSVIAPIVADAAEDLKNNSETTTGSTSGNTNGSTVVGGGGNGSTGTFKRVCADPYSRGCKETDPNGPLHKVQECIGVKSDGLFGGKTESALFSKTQSKSFMAKDVNKICSLSGGGGQQQVQDDEYTIDTENQEAGETDAEGV
jgi:hypothetical protein